MLLLAGCPFGEHNHAGESRIRFLQFSSSTDTALNNATMSTVAAKNETIGFAVTIAEPKSNESLTLRLRRPRIVNSNTALDLNAFSAWQILPLPVNRNRADYVRHTGLSTTPRAIPRALLPLKITGDTIDFASLRSTGQSFQVWIDLKIPAGASAGTYQSAVDVVDAKGTDLLGSAAFSVEVFDFALPNERHLQMATRLDWADLQRLWPERFEAVTPRLMNRTDPRYAPAIHTLDDLVALGQAHRLNVTVPRLQPSVKWPGGTSPAADWKDFDSIVGPWLSGTAFPDKTPLAWWPLPEPEYLNNFDPASRAAYWRVAATHFDQNDWLEKSSVFIPPPASGRLSGGDPILLSADVGVILRAHPRIHVTAPLELDQVQLADAASPNLIPPEATNRLQAASAPLVSTSLTRLWPLELPRPSGWLRTDMPGLTPHVGTASDELDVRLWAYLANLRGSSMVLWPSALPTGSPASFGNESEFAWFYPGQWFGTDGVVPSLQIKWLRRAEQDFEYLWLLRQKNDETIHSLILSRLICRPVELLPTQTVDPTYTLMTGTANATVWTELQKLVAQSILVHRADGSIDPIRQNALNVQTMRWRAFQDRPLLIPRSAQWLWDTLSNRPAGNFINVRVGVDIYNPATDTPDRNTLQWTVLPVGWQVHPQPQATPGLDQFKVRRAFIDGRVDLDKLQPGSRTPVEITFTNGFTQRNSAVRLVLPLAVSLRRESHLLIDGSLEDWDPDDALQDGPMVQMLSQPQVQQQTMALAATPSQIYSNWSDDNFYIGFKLQGSQQTQVKAMRNFVNYNLRRAWGEDLCEILIQPLYIDNSTGPVLHLVLKPGGQWVEKRLDPRSNVDPWQPVEGVAVRYASTLDGPTWRGELAIPWKIIQDPTRGRATLLRFNVIQHKNATGESSSWAGPIDFGRDDAFMGLIQLREPNTPGMK